MNVATMIFRFCSGSTTLARRVRNVSAASTKRARAAAALVALHDLVRLVQPEQPVVDEHALEAFANRPVNERGRDGGIDAARERADHAPLPHLLADAADRFVDERRDRPVTRAAADIEGEVPQDFLAALGVRDFRMEQQRVVAALGRFHRGHRCIGARGDDGEAGWRGGDEIAVARPYAQIRRELAKQARLAPPATVTAAKPNSR
jgi:hypothetical protein